MGRLQKIEDIAAKGLARYLNLKMIVRGRPRYLDPQLDQGEIRFCQKAGFNFTAIVPDNQGALLEDAFKDSDRITMVTRPRWINSNTIIRIGQSEQIGEMHVVKDLIDTNAFETVTPLLSNYSASELQDQPPVVSLVGTPGLVYAPVGSPDNKRMMFLEAWYRLVPGDIVLLSPTPDVLESLAEYEVRRADFQDTRAGNPGIGEPTTIYRYLVELGTKTGLLPFVPPVGMVTYLKAQPLYYRDGYGANDIAIPTNVGPCLLDNFAGGLLINARTKTRLGLRLWDSFGGQVNAAYAPDQEWQLTGANHLVLERPIRSDSLLFWQRIIGNFQFQKGGYFQAELDYRGWFTMSTDLLVPKWPTDIQRGWVIPIYARAPTRCTIQFEPQAEQIFDIPSNTLTFIRPKILPGGPPIDRLMVSFLGSPGSRIEIRDWQFDGSAVNSVSYYLLGSGQVFGQNHWMGGGFSVKPLFFNLDILKARYSDGVSRYNSGYIYI